MNPLRARAASLQCLVHPVDSGAVLVEAASRHHEITVCISLRNMTGREGTLLLPLPSGLGNSTQSKVQLCRRKPDFGVNAEFMDLGVKYYSHLGISTLSYLAREDTLQE